MKKWAVILYQVNICGGYNVIFEHALYAYAQGVEITLVSKRKIQPEEADWHVGTEHIIYKTFEECQNEEFDVVMATEWITAFAVHKLKAKKYLYFVQAVESQFQNIDLLEKLADMTYTMPFRYITEAAWIQKHLKQFYNQEARLVLNGIRKDLFADQSDCYAPRESGKLRVLVEGSLIDWRKNVDLTVQLCRQSKADEIWLMTSTKTDSYEGVDRVFSQVPMKDVHKVYSSCDVLVKLSLVEGMFGPPLEMFHCGGTAITYDIDGHEEYERHGYNSLIAHKGETEQIVTYINRLKDDPQLLEILKKNAYETAQQWRNWNVSSQEFYDVVNKIPDQSEAERNVMKKQSENFENFYNLFLEKSSGKREDSTFRELSDRVEKTGKQVLLYGAGLYAYNTLIKLNDIGMPIHGVAVSQKKDGCQAILGHKVEVIDAYIQDKDQYIVYIAAMKKYQIEIRQILEQYGFTDII